MTDPPFVTIDIDSPVIVSSKNNPPHLNSDAENESVHVPFFKSILMRQILLITAVLAFLVLIAILLAFTITR
jgi:uncharacterized membrane protein YvbJ